MLYEIKTLRKTCIEWNKGRDILRARYHPAKLAACEMNKTEVFPWSRNYQQVKAYAIASHPRNPVSAKADTELGSSNHMVVILA